MARPSWERAGFTDPDVRAHRDRRIAQGPPGGMGEQVLLLGAQGLPLGDQPGGVATAQERPGQLIATVSRLQVPIRK